MSEEKKNDAQTAEEPQAEEKKPAAKKAEEPVKKEPDVVDEEELDIEIERVAPKRGRSCGPVAWILFILILALVAVFGGMKVKRERDEAAAEARKLREQTYQAQQGSINENIDKASAFAMKGDVVNAVKQLQAAEKKWGEMASTANGANDTDKAQFAMAQQGDLKNVLDELAQYQEKADALQARAEKLAGEVDALEKERDEFNSKVNERILELAVGGDAGATAVEAEKPAAEEEAPAAKEQKPEAKKEKAKEETPAAKEEAPAAKEQKPEAKKEKAKEQKPEAKKEKPAKKKKAKPADEKKKAEEPKESAEPEAETSAAEPANTIAR